MAKKARTPRQPRRIERSYGSRLVRYSREIQRELLRVIRPYLADARTREDADIPLDLFSIDMSAAEYRILLRRRGEDIAAEWAEDLEAWSARDIGRILRISPDVLPGVDLSAIIGRNVDLIDSLAPRMIADVRRTVVESVARGSRVEVLARSLRERFRVGESRARLIARDQTLTANAEIARTRMRGAGVDRYEWSTSGDERVRPEHEALDGKIFTWDHPPAVGHPGEDIQCRCVAVPVLD